MAMLAFRASLYVWNRNFSLNAGLHPNMYAMYTVRRLNTSTLVSPIVYNFTDLHISITWSC